MINFENITLIGMPGSGKTTVGRMIAQKLNFHFIDTDKYIEKKEGRKLQDIIDSEGDTKFCEIEEERILELLPLKNHILAPGGSVIYSEKVMRTLEKISIIIFLDLPLETIKERLDNKEFRGIVGLKSFSLSKLYEQRIRLYQKYADLHINCSGLSPSEIVNKITDELK